jgi:hypothetical protein
MCFLHPDVTARSVLAQRRAGGGVLDGFSHMPELNPSRYDGNSGNHPVATSAPLLTR